MSFQRLFVLLALALACQTPLRGQQDACMRRSIPVNVLTQDGKVVTGLDATNFRGTYRSKPVGIISVTTDTLPRRILVLLDASGSMMDSSHDWNLALDVADALVTNMPPQTIIGLAVFAMKVDWTIELTSDRQALKQELTHLRAGRKLFPKGLRKTALWDAIQSGLVRFGTLHDADVIYAITDGGDNASKTEPSALERMLLAAGVRLFAFGLGREFRGVMSDEALGAQKLIDLVIATGGLAVGLPRQPVGLPREQEPEPTRFSIDVASQFQEIESFERLGIELPESVDKPRGWDLKVTNLSKLKTRDLIVLYPRKLMPCPAAASDGGSRVR